jgi:hypothetical protein
LVNCHWADVLDLAGGPGSDLINTYVSAADQVSLDILETTSDPWSVDIRKSDVNWASDFHFWIQRTSGGSGSGSIADGLTYLEITDTDQDFFTGSGDKTDIHIQYQLSGVSAATILADTYSITIYYTVIEE